MVFNFKSLLILTGMCIAFNSNAQTLQGLWDKTIAYYKGFDVQNQQILLAKQDSLAQQIKYKPQVQAQFQQSLSSVNGTSGAFLPLPGIMNISGPQVNEGSSSTFNHFLSASMNWDLINFGRKDLDKDISSSKIAYSKLNQHKFALEIQKKLANRYIEFLYLQILDKWYVRHAERYATVLEITKGLAKAGIVPGADSLLANSSLKNVQSSLSHVQGKLDASIFLIKELSNVNSLPIQEVYSKPFLEILKSQDSVQSEHPILQMKKQQQQSLELLGKKQDREIFPRIMFLGGLANRSSGITSNGYVNSGYTDLYQDFANNYFIGVGVTWNLQEVFQSKSNKRQYDLLRQNNLLEQGLVQNEIKTSLDQLNAEITAAYVGIDQSNISRTQAEEAFQLYKTRYEGGLINLSELLQVQEILLQSEKQNLVSYLNYWNLMVDKSYQQADFSLLFNHF